MNSTTVSGSAKMSVRARCSRRSDGRLEEDNDLPYWKLDAFEAMPGQQQSASIPPNTRGSIVKGDQTQMDQICTLAVLRTLSSRHVTTSRRKSCLGVVLHRIRRFDNLAVS